jgi:TPR repeat protein
LAPLQAAPVAAPEPAPKQVATLSIQPLAAPAQAAPHLSAGELTTLMSRGRRFIESGDFSSARPVYRRAAEAGYAEAALALGETYDPRALAERGAVGINGDVEQARKWYERAGELGSLEAPTRLGRLPRN